MLTLNGKAYTDAQLRREAGRKLQTGKLADREYPFWRFIQEWLDDSATVLLQTSGTTGKPKMLRAKKEAMRQSAQITADFFGYQPGDKALLCLPAGYIAGKMMIVRAFVSGLHLLVVPPSKEALLATKEPIYLAPAVPMQAEHALKQGHRLGHIRHLLIGGAPLSPLLQEQLHQVEARAWLSYGMTETLTHVAMKGLNGPQAGKAFHALPGVYFATDEQNRLIIHAPHVEEPVHTNDIVSLINTQAFEWLGRADHVINSGGIKLHPEQIEAKLQAVLSQPFFVTGLPDSRLGEKLVLVIEGDALNEETKSQMLALTSKQVASYEKPRNIITISEFPRTASGKIQREVIKTWL